MGARLRAILVLGLLQTMPAAAETAVPVTGYWYTEGSEKGVYFQLIFDRREDGTFLMQAREVHGCAPGPVQLEAGTWSYSDGVLLNWTKAVAARPVADTEDYHDKFQLTAGDDDHYSAFDTKTQITWSMVRVPASFRFPTPKPCSTS